MPGPAAAPAFVDIHCHLVPEIDDGAKSWEDTLAMAQMAVADGIDTIVMTPHQLGAFSHNSGAAIRAAVAQVQEFLTANEIPLCVLPGADVRIEADLVSLVKRGQVVSLGDHRRHVLLELPHELYVPLDRLLAEMRAAGMTGILSHPERNHGILADPGVLRPLVDAGCLMQVTAGSLLGAFGPHSQKLAEWMLQQKLVHFLASDGHGPKARRPLLRQSFERAVELVGLDQAVAMCCDNPRCVAEGKPVHVRQVRDRTWGGWFGMRKAG